MNYKICYLLGLSSFEALKNHQADIELVYTILNDFTDLVKAGKEIILCWIPGPASTWW